MASRDKNEAHHDGPSCRQSIPRGRRHIGRLVVTADCVDSTVVECFGVQREADGAGAPEERRESTTSDAVAAAAAAVPSRSPQRRRYLLTY